MALEYLFSLREVRHIEMACYEDAASSREHDVAGDHSTTTTCHAGHDQLSGTHSSSETNTCEHDMLVAMALRRSWQQADIRVAL